MTDWKGERGVVEEGNSANTRYYHKCLTSVQPERRCRLGCRNIVDKVRFKKITTAPPGKITETFENVLRIVLKMDLNHLTIF